MADSSQKNNHIQSRILVIIIILAGVLILFFSLQEKITLDTAQQEARERQERAFDAQEYKTLSEEDLIEMNLRLDDLDLGY